jgi:transposase-like protein
MARPRKYDEETRERVVRMVLDEVGQGSSNAAARRKVGELLDVNPATIRGWLRRDGEAGVVGKVDDAGLRDEVKRLRVENARLKRANEILKTSAAFFAQAEVDRRLV